MFVACSYPFCYFDLILWKKRLSMLKTKRYNISDLKWKESFDRESHRILVLIFYRHNHNTIDFVGRSSIDNNLQGFHRIQIVNYYQVCTHIYEKILKGLSNLVFIISLKQVLVLKLFSPHFSHFLGQDTHLQKSIAWIWLVSHKVLSWSVTNLHILN